MSEGEVHNLIVFQAHASAACSLWNFAHKLKGSQQYSALIEMNVFKVAVSSGHQIMPEGFGRHFKGDLSLRSRQRTALVLAYLCKAEILGHRSA